MSNPVLCNWRWILYENGPELGVFLGEVTGHPLLNDGWVITSSVQWISDDRSCARTLSRLYELKEEFPRDQALPEKPRNILLTNLVESHCAFFGYVTWEKLTELKDYATCLCGPLPPQN